MILKDILLSNFFLPGSVYILQGGESGRENLRKTTDLKLFDVGADRERMKALWSIARNGSIGLD